MKHYKLLPVLLSILLTGCSTYQYTARQTDVRQRPIDAKEQMASITVNYAKQVTATSDYQMTKKDAIADAEYRCIQEAKIDVVIDPIFKIEYNPFKFKRRFKATIIGYAGMYKEEQNRLDDSKRYTLEEIEKYKLLYDGNFPQYYYQKSNEGDRYFFNSGASRLNEGLSLKTTSLVSLDHNSTFPRARKSTHTSDKTKPTNIFQGYIELAGHFKGGAVTMGGVELSNSYGCRFNEYAYLGGGFGMATTLYDAYEGMGGTMQIPVFVDVRAYCPTPVVGMYPFLGISIGPQFQFINFTRGDVSFEPQAYFRLYGGFDYKRFTMGVGYQLIGGDGYKTHFGFVKLGIRLGKKKMY